MASGHGRQEVDYPRCMLGIYSSSNIESASMNASIAALPVRYDLADVPRLPGSRGHCTRSRPPRRIGTKPATLLYSAMQHTEREVSSELLVTSRGAMSSQDLKDWQNRF